MKPSDSLRSEAARRILIKDGAYGTQIQQYRLKEADYCGGLDLLKDQRGNNDVLNLASGEIVREVAHRYTSKDGKARWVAGAIGPTNKTLSLSPNVNDPAFREVDFDQVKDVYREQVDALVDGGVDFILVETIFDTLNAKAAVMATLEAEQDLGRELPLMISMTLTDLSGRNLSGHTVEAFWASVRHAKPVTIS